MKKKILISTILLLLTIGAYYYINVESSDTDQFVFSEISRRDVDVVITCSGTLEATSTVDVGTQVSGKISKLFADFNSEVRKGQLLAVIDTVNLVAQLKDSQASLDKARAEYKLKLATHEKNKKLFEKAYISELDFIQSETDIESAKAQLVSAESALDKAKINLDYAFIYAPISGKVINRSVEEGQTVAASFSAPTLYTIAEDLSSMRILADVDESDIGQIREGQKVKFTVQAYSDKYFDGTVQQIRMQPTIVSNVVNYVVVIKAGNSEKLLLPGMTATIDFYINSSPDALVVPNTALRVKPTQEVMEQIHKNMEQERIMVPDSLKGQNGRIPGPPPSMDENIKPVFYKDKAGNLKISIVKTGITDGKYTEIVNADGISEGLEVLTGIAEEKTEEKSTNSNMLGQQQRGGQMPPPPMM